MAERLKFLPTGETKIIDLTPEMISFPFSQEFLEKIGYSEIDWSAQCLTDSIWVLGAVHQLRRVRFALRDLEFNLVIPTLEDGEETILPVGRLGKVEGASSPMEIFFPPQHHLRSLRHNPFPPVQLISGDGRIYHSWSFPQKVVGENQSLLAVVLGESLTPQGWVFQIFFLMPDFTDKILDHLERKFVRGCSPKAERRNGQFLKH